MSLTLTLGKSGGFEIGSKAQIMRKNIKFSLPNGPDGYDQQQLINKLSEHYSIIKERTVSERFSFFDTFDWRIFNKSLVFYGDKNKLCLRKLFKNRNIHTTEITSPPVFIWDFPDDELKKYLAPIIKMRALLKLVDLHSLKTPFRILNPDEKTVIRLLYEEIRMPSKKNELVASHVWLKPVKGYLKYSRNLTKRFENAGFSISNKEDIYVKALALVDKKPGSYSAKLTFQLDPDMCADDATKIVLRFLLQVIRINEHNIAREIDTEVLHDFRVAIRRTRAALSQIKSVFPISVTDRFKKDFAFVGKITNQLRDMDVYLLDESTYKEMLPAVLGDDIDPLFDYLREKRSRVFEEVIKRLRSRNYHQILMNWEAFLNEPARDSHTAYNANLPIIDLARKRIYKKYRRIVKNGNQILKNTQDEMLHDLRMECKKLRYLMEFFSSLFPPKKITILIRQLKNLQDNLGDFNDLCVQGDYLLNISRELPETEQSSKKTFVAIGSLVGVLEREKQIVKGAFAATFKKYASPGNKLLFRELFTLK